MPHQDPDFTEFVRCGCEKAFGRLVSRHVAAVHSGARRLLGGRADAAADVAQAVFIQLARRAASLPRDLVVSAWLHRQTVRTALNILRGEARRAAREQTAADLMLMNDHDSPSADALLMPHIDRAISQLPDIDQRVLAMRFFDHCELHEIGERLGITAGAVQKRLARAMDRLRNRLARRGVTLSAAFLTLWLSEESVHAVPPPLTASIIAGALPHTAPGTGALSSFLTLMASIKSLTAGAALGLLTGGAWSAWHGVNNATASAVSIQPAGQRSPLPAAAKSKALGLSSVPAAATTAEGLLDQLLALTSDPDNEITRQRMAVWTARVPAELWESLVVLADERLSETERRRWLPDLARQWARVDPAAAIPLLAGRREGNGLAASGFRVWHKTAPDEARRWLVEHQDDPRLATALPGIVSVVAEGLAGNSEDAALRWASQLQGDDLRAAALMPLWKKAEATGSVDGWSRLCARLLSEDDAEFSAFALRQALGKWTYRYAKRGHPSSGLAEADRWLASLPPGPLTGIAAEAILSEAMKWAEPAPTENALALLRASGPQAASEAATRLVMQSRQISPSAREWLLPLLTGPERETAIFRAARQVIPGAGMNWSSTLPSHGAAIEWAAELSDSAVRDPLIYGLFRQWLQFQNERRQADYAGIWLEKAEFPPEIKALMQQAKDDFQPKGSE